VSLNLGVSPEENKIYWRHFRTNLSGECVDLIDGL
jgi:hypothetical protein